MEKEEEDANLLERCEEKRRNGQNIGNVKRKQNMQNTPWTKEELKEYEGALPRLKKGDLEKVSRLCKAKTGVGCDGFHPKVLLDLTKETRREIVEFFERVEQSGKWSQQACTTMFFLIPKNVTSERAITKRFKRSINRLEQLHPRLHTIHLGLHRAAF